MQSSSLSRSMCPRGRTLFPFMVMDSYDLKNFFRGLSGELAEPSKHIAGNVYQTSHALDSTLMAVVVSYRFNSFA